MLPPIAGGAVVAGTASVVDCMFGDGNGSGSPTFDSFATSSSTSLLPPPVPNKTSILENMILFVCAKLIISIGSKNEKMFSRDVSSKSCGRSSLCFGSCSFFGSVCVASSLETLIVLSSSLCSGIVFLGALSN